MTDASVELWGRRIGAVSWDETRALGVFQYQPAFAASGIEVSPLVMPVREGPYVFPALGRDAFMGLPGLLADALPDSFGNRLIDVWLAETGRSADSFSPVDRLCYVGTRGMGALEFSRRYADVSDGTRSRWRNSSISPTGSWTTARVWRDVSVPTMIGRPWRTS